MTSAVDRVVAVVGLAATSPVLAVAAIGIKVSSRGPVVYSALRAGVGGQPFTMLKLRTMHLGSHHGGRITSATDSRIFPWGALLRRLKVDEIPQLVNVLRGEMALVGPRPEDVSIVSERYDAMMWESLSVPPGMTSPGSLHYFADEHSLPTDRREAERLYLDTLLPEKIALDLVYVRHRSLRYELEVLFRTMLGMVGLGTLFGRRMNWERAQARQILDEVRP